MVLLRSKTSSRPKVGTTFGSFEEQVLRAKKNGRFFEGVLTQPCDFLKSQGFVVEGVLTCGTG